MSHIESLEKGFEFHLQAPALPDVSVTTNYMTNFNNLIELLLTAYFFYLVFAFPYCLCLHTFHMHFFSSSMSVCRSLSLTHLFLPIPLSPYLSSLPPPFHFHIQKPGSYQKLFYLVSRLRILCNPVQSSKH